MLLLKNLWNYRGFIHNSVKNELVARFSRSKAGFLWMIINPLSQVAIYALILSNVLAAKLPGVSGKFGYAIYLTAGLLAWSLFAEIVNRSLNLFIEQSNLIKKMAFPRITLPAIVVWSSFINNSILFAATIVIFIALGHSLSFVALWLIPLALLTSIFALGLGLVLGVFNVFLRDVGQVVPIVLQVWFWFTPIVYPKTIIPEYLLVYMEMNPMYSIVDNYQSIVLTGEFSDVSSLVWVSVLSAILIVLSLVVFRKASPEMVDVL